MPDPHRMTLCRRLVSSDTEAPVPRVGVAGLRIIAGVMVATLHGWHKVVQGWQYVADGADWPLLCDAIELGFPLPVVLAALAALSQFLGGWLLALGAYTRLAALMVTGTLLTATVFNLQTGGPDVQLASVYALVTGAFVLVGGGYWSVDRLLER